MSATARHRPAISFSTISHRTYRSKAYGFSTIESWYWIIVLTSALHKLQFGVWWSGVAYWYPLNPPFELTRERLREQATSDATLREVTTPGTTSFSMPL